MGIVLQGLSLAGELVESADVLRADPDVRDAGGVPSFFAMLFYPVENYVDLVDCGIDCVVCSAISISVVCHSDLDLCSVSSNERVIDGASLCPVEIKVNLIALASTLDLSLFCSLECSCCHLKSLSVFDFFD